MNVISIDCSAGGSETLLQRSRVLCSLDALQARRGPGHSGDATKIDRGIGQLCEHACSQGGPISCRLNLRSGGLCQLRPEEHGPGACESGSEKVDRSRAALRYRLRITMLIPIVMPIPIEPIASTMISKRGGCQATKHDSCQPPFSFTIDHALLPLHSVT
jgi:hypothetical protein